jgi:hypothetical protein
MSDRIRQILHEEDSRLYQAAAEQQTADFSLNSKYLAA